MSNIKHFTIVVIAVSTFVQLGRTFFSNSHYEKIFKFISSFFIMFIIFLMFISFYKNGSVTQKYYFDVSFNKTETDIQNQFEKNLEKIIKNDIHNKFYVNLNLVIKTDFKSLKIYVLKTGNSNEKDIIDYIKNTYCTAKDEVIIIDDSE